MNKSIELLAPAGNETALHAAVQSGADAVYIGGTKFGARHSAKNFTIDDIMKQTEYCHLYGVDVHVTVNTLIKEKELSEVVEYARELNSVGVDALIIQDMGAAELIHKALPDMQLHASTQMTVTSLEGVKYLEDMGFSRVVLARELNKKEIETICAGARAEIEVFAHGAICMCYSGQCLMSGILGGRSGNRGRCAQPCRLNYTMLENGKSCGSAYVLSTKDMALVRHLKELRDIGVSSLKIEGRLKRAEYVSAVVGVYRKYIDSDAEVSKQDMRELHDAFSRSGFTDGYFTGNLGAPMMSHKNPGNDNNTFTDEAKKRAMSDSNVRKIPVSISGSMHKGEPIRVSVFDSEGNFAEAEGKEAVEKAANKPLDKRRFIAQLVKTGSTPFEVTEMYTDMDDDVTAPIKDINGARREALEKLASIRSSRPTGRSLAAELPKKVKRQEVQVKFSAEVRTAEQGRAAAESGIDLIYAPAEAASELQRNFKDIEIVTRTEEIFREQRILTGAASVSSNAAIQHYGKSGIRLYGTHRLNVFNAASLEHYRKLTLVTISPELRLSEIKDIAEHSNIPFELIGYGRIPLMLMKNCPIKAMGRCQKHKDKISLKDRRGEEFPIICRKGCMAELLNSKPMYMADKLSDLIKTGASRIKLVFTLETPQQCRRIIKIYKEALNGSVSKMRENTFTRGHYYRGVE
ncbi:MAG: DUF3656 domain-containing protein [bacterium]|nr:DUF3656 domain-containing protein [bacterium]